MHTWLILACLFGVAFTGTVKPANDTEGVCNVEGIKIRVGEEYQPPGKCFLEVCKKATFVQGDFHQQVSMVFCPIGKVDKHSVQPVRRSETFPDCCHKPVSNTKNKKNKIRVKQ
ncbi:hypothetical protein GE061_019444 [Apolygus lucorum]|uniref:Single domain-containing protein n=1 Tax=Apolygus lucorum TaxID=248454 RepID=A0A8S9XCJ1_APOLU|nr:hypothetical protein GE061_019444 [Apolygus lucorum]